MPNSQTRMHTHTGSPMDLYRRKRSFMKSTLPSNLSCTPNAFSNKQKSSSSGIMVWTICQHFLNAFELTFAIDKALVISNVQSVPWLSHHLCLIHVGTLIVIAYWLLDPWISLHTRCSVHVQWYQSMVHVLWEIIANHSLCLFHTWYRDGAMVTK